MAILKKTVAFLTAAMITACVAGCADTSYAMKADNKEIKAGIYIDYLYNEMVNQIQTMAYSGVTGSPLNQKIEGKKFADYVEEVALKTTKEHVVINNKFDELKLTLDPDETKQINSNLTDSWEQSAEDYEKQGISKESLKENYLTLSKRAALFNSFYAENGSEEVTVKDLEKYVDDTFLRFKYISFEKNSEDQDAEKESVASRDKYFKMAEKLDFAKFDEVIDAYSDEMEEKQAEEQATEEATDVEDVSDEEAVDVSEAEVEDEVEVDEDAETEDVEEDPYQNEQIINYDTVKDNEDNTEYVNLLKAIKDMEIGKATLYEDDNLYYIIIKGDITERSEEYIADDNNRESTLYQMKKDDFQSKLDSWIKEIKFTMNDDAMKTFSATNVYSIMTEDYDK